MFGRREFISGSTAFAASIALAKGRTEPKLRVGVLSDIHITTDEDVPAFEKALRYFDTRKVEVWQRLWLRQCAPQGVRLGSGTTPFQGREPDVLAEDS